MKLISKALVKSMVALCLLFCASVAHRDTCSAGIK